MRTIFVHRFAGVLSAYGLGLSNLIYETQVRRCVRSTPCPGYVVARNSSVAQQPCALPYSHDAVEGLQEKIAGMKAQLEAQLKAKGFGKDRVQMEIYLNLRYDGTDTRYATPTHRRVIGK